MKKFEIIINDFNKPYKVLIPLDYLLKKCYTLIIRSWINQDSRKEFDYGSYF